MNAFSVDSVVHYLINNVFAQRMLAPNLHNNDTTWLFLALIKVQWPW